jgi:hypothetical protein
MENKNKNIERYFKERLESFEHNPPDANWDIIAKKLGHRNKKGLALLILRIAAGMAILISTGIGYYWLTKPSGESKQAVLSNNQLDAVLKDTIRFTASDKSKSVAPSLKRSKKSGRPVPIRKAYIIPAISAVSSFETGTQRDLQFPALTKITGHNKQQLLPSNLPSELSHSRSSAPAEFSRSAAWASLLPEYEDATTKKVKKNRWSLGSEIAPLYSDRSVSSDYLQADMINTLNETESGILAYAGGIHVAFSPGRRLSVQSGIYYSRYGQEKNRIETLSNKYAGYAIEENKSGKYLTVTNSTGIISSKNPKATGYDIVVYCANDATPDYDNLNASLMNGQLNSSSSENTDITLKQYFDYFEVPLLVKYKLIDRKIDFSLSGGLVTNFLVGNKVDLVKNGETTRFGETSEINTVNYQGSFGLGFEYPINSGFAFTVEPRFRYYINPINKSSQVSVRPFSFGFFAGFNYVF